MTSSISVGFFSPSSLNGCVLWLDGSSLNLTNGATVSTWPSLGPVSYTTTSTAGRFPIYASNVRNGLGCVQYATGQTTILSNFALPATQSIFLLYYPINTSAGSPFLEQGPDVNGNDGFFFHAQNNANYAIRNGGTFGSVNFGTIAQANTWQMIEGLNKDPNAGNTMSFYSNATLIASNGVQNGTATITNTLFLNGRNNTNTLSYPSYVAELIIYNTPLNNFGRQQVEGYLAWKWGLTTLLPATHPYKNLPYLILTEPIPRAIPTNAFILPINTFSTIKTFTFPAASSFPGRMLVLKDYLGYASTNTIRLSTTGVDTIERSNVSSMILSNNYGAWWFNNDGVTKWYLTSAYLNTMVYIGPAASIPAALPYQANLVVDLRGSSYSAGGSTWLNSVDNSTWTMTNTTYDAVNGGPLFNGSSAFAYKASLTGWSGSTFTIICYYYKSSTVTTGTILCMNRTPSNVTNEAIFGENAYFDYSNTFGLNFATTTAINTSGLVMNSFVKNTTTGTFYRNSSANGTQTAGTNVTVGNADFAIGKDYRDNNSFLAGTIKRYVIYNIALTVSDIANIYSILSSS